MKKMMWNFTLGGGGGLDKFGSFSHFFIVLIHANLQRKVYFVGGGDTTPPESRKI